MAVADKEQIPSSISIKIESPHTISTAMELLLAKIAALDAKVDANKDLITADAQHVATELRKDSAEVERRLGELNHAHARLDTVVNHNLNRETWDTFVANYTERTQRIETLLSEKVPQTEFRAYQQSTGRAVVVQETAQARQEGSREGVKLTGSNILAALVGLGAFITVVVTVSNYVSSSRITQPQSPPQIIYVTPTTAPGQTTTTTTKP